jgi:CheY-like chemotaxis protein
MPVGARILVADDNEVIQTLLKHLFEEQGYVVTQVYTGVDMTREIALNPLPDVIVLDVMLPDADGRDLLVRLKKDAKTAAVPVVVWSGRHADFERRIALRLGAEDYVEKGRPSRLISKIQEILLRLRQTQGIT